MSDLFKKFPLPWKVDISYVPPKYYSSPPSFDNDKTQVVDSNKTVVATFDKFFDASLLVEAVNNLPNKVKKQHGWKKPGKKVYGSFAIREVGKTELYFAGNNLPYRTNVGVKTAIREKMRWNKDKKFEVVEVLVKHEVGKVVS